MESHSKVASRFISCRRPLCFWRAQLPFLSLFRVFFFINFFLPPVASPLAFLQLPCCLPSFLSLPRLFAPFSLLLILIKERETPSFINEALNEKGGMLLSGTKKKKFPAIHSLQLKSKEEILPEDSLALVPWWLSFTLCFFF